MSSLADSPISKLARFARELLRLIGRPVRRSHGTRGIVLQPYRGYGSREEIFLIGRVFRQSPAPGAQGSWDVRGHVRDVLRRVMRRSVAGAAVRARFYGAETICVTDSDGYFRVSMAPGAAVAEDKLWHPLDLSLDAPAQAQAQAEIFIPPREARFAVISDIDDTVMYTGVANRLGMLWRLFVMTAESRTAFPGVAEFYRALHTGVTGTESNPMLYVSRAPWGIYDILVAFFNGHDIPAGPLLFLREWGITWTSPLPRRAVDHKRVLIENMMTLYDDMPFILIGDSGQHDPEVYRDIVARHPDRVIAVYIRDVSLGLISRADEIEAAADIVKQAGSELVLASNSVAMAEHAAKLGLIHPQTVDAVRSSLSPVDLAEMNVQETRIVGEMATGRIPDINVPQSAGEAPAADDLGKADNGKAD